MTAVGIPMIFAGEEFADEHDLVIRHPEKQVDAVNFDRRRDFWRQRVFEYVRPSGTLPHSLPSPGAE